MKKFLIKILFYFALIYLVNILIGLGLNYDFKKKTDQKCYYPSIRWNEFYDIPNNTLEVLFLGSSHSYRCYNPTVFDSITSYHSFNLGSSLQTITTSYFVLNEALKWQKPEIVFLDVFPFTLNYSQLEPIEYNLPYIRSLQSKADMFCYGLNFKEKIQYLLPTYRKRSRLFSTIRFLLIPNYQVTTDEIYHSKGFVTSNKQLSITEENTLDVWKTTKMTDLHLLYLKKITDLCKSNDIRFILTRTPTAKDVYRNLHEFDYFIERLAVDNFIEYLTFDDYAHKYLTQTDFKDIGHVNISGANKITKHLGILTKDHFK